MKKQILLGDEAIALGAIHSGISAAYGYPGTPSTEIMEACIGYAKLDSSFKAAWGTNEKTAYETALGTSLAGRRALVTMKHVGLNVAADPFMSSALVSLHGGLVLAVADDPGMHSSQNEQDSRYFADFAKVICLEPADHQELYDMTREAFDLSEKFHMPVVLRIVTRLAHSRGIVMTSPPRAQNAVSKPSAPNQWILLPSNARRQWNERLASESALKAHVGNLKFNSLAINQTNKDLAVITTGTARNYYLEVATDLKEAPSHLHIGAYPYPAEKLRQVLSHAKKVVFLEEGYPFIERFARGVLPQAVEISGRQTGEVPADGELNPDLVRKALGLPRKNGVSLKDLQIPGRPPQLCPGCPHIDSYGSLKQALSAHKVHLVTADIGCSTLGAMPEYNAIESCVCMGASIGMAKGASEAGLTPVVAVIGDSTFLHSGMNGLIDALSTNTDMTVLILDNQTTGMTGGQKTILPSARLKDLILGLGITPEHLHVIDTHRTKVAQNAEIIKREIEYKGLSVIIAVRECIETAKRQIAEKKGAQS